jgi:hypothetical protein
VETRQALKEGGFSYIGMTNQGDTSQRSIIRVNNRGRMTGHLLAHSGQIPFKIMVVDKIVTKHAAYCDQGFDDWVINSRPAGRYNKNDNALLAEQDQNAHGDDDRQNGMQTFLFQPAACDKR